VDEFWVTLLGMLTARFAAVTSSIRRAALSWRGSSMRVRNKKLYLIKLGWANA
jgi:hypothetical protein